MTPDLRLPNFHGLSTHNPADTGEFFRPLPVTTESSRSRVLVNRDLPPVVRDYLSTHNGETRFDFGSTKHQETRAYIDRQYEGFKVSTEPELSLVMKDYGVKTLDELRAKMMDNGHNAPMIRGKLLVPFDHHMPGKGHFDGDFFYWDNLWSVMWSAKRQDPEFGKGVINNWKYEFKYLGYVPNSNREKIMNRSQPPVGALAYRAIEDSLPDTQENRAWKKDTINFLKSEYFNAWVDDPVGEANYLFYERYKGGHSDVWTNQTQTPTGLSQYAGADLRSEHYAAEAASGEDCTPRFKGRAGDFNATDLQGLLGTYEKLFADTAETVEERAHWESQLKKRTMLVNELMWNEEKGWYMDWDQSNGKQSDVMALAAFALPLAGIVPPERLDRMVKNLNMFKLPYGLAVTTGEEISDTGRVEQWKWPNVWAPREDFVFQVLMQHPEYDAITEDLLVRSMVGSAEFHARHQTLAETRDGRDGRLGRMSLYNRDEKEEGFLWTAVTYVNNERRLKEVYARRDMALAA